MPPARLTRSQDGEVIEEHFHLDRSISVGHIITTITIVVSMIWWASTVETRLAVQESSVRALQETDRRHESESSAMRAEIRDQLAALNAKVDRLVERQAVPRGGDAR